MNASDTRQQQTDAHNAAMNAKGKELEAAAYAKVFEHLKFNGYDVELKIGNKDDWSRIIVRKDGVGTCVELKVIDVGKSSYITRFKHTGVFGLKVSVGGGGQDYTRRYSYKAGELNWAKCMTAIKEMVGCKIAANLYRARKAAADNAAYVARESWNEQAKLVANEYELVAASVTGSESGICVAFNHVTIEQARQLLAFAQTNGIKTIGGAA